MRESLAAFRWKVKGQKVECYRAVPKVWKGSGRFFFFNQTRGGQAWRIPENRLRIVNGFSAPLKVLNYNIIFIL